jgi:alkylated DNA repair dioxygenase AlkB
MSNNSQQPALFDEVDHAETNPIDLAQISGLMYLPEFIDQEAHDQLLSSIDSHTWLTDLKRRVQHYGFKYDYSSRRIDLSMRLGPLPNWATVLAGQLVERGLLPELPDQLIVNEYEPGQGIANHIDCVPCFTDTIASLSLGSSCVMNFTNKETRQAIPLLLDPRSLVVLRGGARYSWTHGIASRKSDVFQSRTIYRRRRVSLTFRKVILDDARP